MDQGAHREGPVPLSCLGEEEDMDQGARREGPVPLSCLEEEEDMDQGTHREGPVPLSCLREEEATSPVHSLPLDLGQGGTLPGRWPGLTWR